MAAMETATNEQVGDFNSRMLSAVDMGPVPSTVEYFEDINRLHTKALDLNQQSVDLKSAGNAEGAKNTAIQAMQTESWAAGLLAGNRNAEPHRGLLFLSASRLALNCGEPFQARLLAMSGLQMRPSPEVSELLQEIVSYIETGDRAILTANATAKAGRAALVAKQAEEKAARKGWHWGR
jgi:hypothetical protein